MEVLSFISLGTKGAWYARAANGKFDSNLPVRLMQCLTHHSALSPVTRMWFGYGETFVAELANGTLLVQLGQHYRSLAEELRKPRLAKIAGLAMNLVDGSKFACVFRNGEICYHGVGNSFKEWHQQNIATSGAWNSTEDGLKSENIKLHNPAPRGQASSSSRGSSSYDVKFVDGAGVGSGPGEVILPNGLSNTMERAFPHGFPHGFAGRGKSGGKDMRSS